MLSKRILGLLLIALLFGTFNLYTSSVQADDWLQSEPRLDGKNVYFTESSGEASRFDRTDAGLSRFAGLLTQLGASLFTLEWRTGFPTDADLIVIAGPTTDLTSDQVARLWAYVNNHGHLLLLANPNTSTRSSALTSSNGLFDLMWADMGIRADDDVAVTEGTLPIYAPPSTEEAAAQALAATEEAAATEQPSPTPQIIGQTPILVTDFSTGNYNKTNPITQDLTGQAAFFTARSLDVDSSIQGFTNTPLIFTPNNFYGETDFATYLSKGTFSFNIGKDISRGALPLAASYENDTTSVRIVVIGDRDFATNGGGLRTSPPNSAGFVYPDNPRFMVNAVTWLLSAPSVTEEFPTAGPTATATITPSITPTSSPTPTVSPTVNLSETATPLPTNTPTDTATPIPTETSVIIATNTPIALEAATEVATPEVTVQITPAASS